MDSIGTREDRSYSPGDLIKKSSKLIANPIMESKKKDLALAKKIQRKCYAQFLKEKSELMEAILGNESKLIYNIPK